MTGSDKNGLDSLTKFDRPEEIKPVVGFESRYDVSNRGRVISSLTGRDLRPGPTSRGYLSVVLYDGSKPKKPRSFLVHRLVAAAFIGPNPDGHIVNHVDGDKTNNRVENLEYVAHRENSLHAEYNGLAPRRYRGQDNCNAKLTDADVRQIKAMIALGVQIKSIARAYRVDPKVIYLIRDGKSWAHVPDVRVTVEAVA